MGAVSMTEPDAGFGSRVGADVRRLDGDHYVINGTKTFVTNGLNADVVVLAVKTNLEERHKASSLIVVESGTRGFERGRKIDKIGQRSQDTCELFFSDARIPVANRLGPEGAGFKLLTTNLAQERLSMAFQAVAGARQALRWTVDYCKTRKAFGGPLTDQQFIRFELADMTTSTEIAQIYVDRLLDDYIAGRTTPVDAAKAKFWTTEMQNDVLDRCLQLHGGYGYTREFPIARAYLDGRVQTIYGGTTQIMKEIIGRSIAAGVQIEDTR
jgi:acyl-CoA dehydrogenase